MVRDYELMYIVRPDLDEEGLTAATQAVEDLIAGQGGETLRTTSWGKRRLAYEIQKLRDGHYVILHIRLDGGRVREVERQLMISETVIRHLVTEYVAPREERDEDGAGEEGAALGGAAATGDGHAGATGVGDEDGGETDVAEETEDTPHGSVVGDDEGEPVGVGAEDEEEE
jgi:small subunit ribosomal protein S6